MKKFVYLSTLVAIAFLASACSSNKTTSGATSGSGVGNTVAVSDLSQLPSLNLSGLDSLNPNASISAKSVASGTSTVGQLAEPCCMSVSFMKPQMLAEMKLMELYPCYVDTIQNNDPTFKIPSGEYAYYFIQLGENASTGQPTGVRIAVGNFDTTDTTELRLQWAEDDGENTPSQNGDFEIVGNTATKTWSGYLTDHYNQGQGGNGFVNSNFSIVMKAADDLTEAFDFKNVASATATVTIGGSPTTSDVQSNTTYQEGFKLTFDYDASSSLTSGVLNTVSGSFSQASGSTTGTMVSKFNASVGAAKLSYSDSVNGQFSDSEACSTTASPPTVLDESDSSVSGIYNVVAAIDLSMHALNFPTDVNSAVAFVNTFSGEPPSGKSFTTINAISFDFSTCTALIQEATQDNSAAVSTCFSQSQTP